MSKSDFTFLTKEQIYGSNKLEIFKKMSARGETTDFSTLTGLFSLYSFRGVPYWTKTHGRGATIYAVMSENTSDIECDCRHIGARMCLPLDSINDTISRTRNSNGILEIKYGYYPQTAVSADEQFELFKACREGKMKKNGNSYTVNSLKPHDRRNSFQPHIYEEYEYKGRRYIKADAKICHDYISLSNGQQYDIYDRVWVEVEPIEWLVDEKNKMIVSKKVLFSGIPFENLENFPIDKYNFDNTFIKQFIDDYFAKEIMQCRYLSCLDNKENDDPDRKLVNSQRRKNPYGFEFNKVSEEDIIKGAVKSGVAVFLHGQSGEGKSARVKQLDPDCEIIYLRNATPESLNGKSVYNQETGEMIDVPPTWLTKLQEKCEKEDDKLHIVFFDEITNALPSIQGMAFNIVLDREVNGKWKLPENARIVAAGNDLNDSLAANTLAEPLFNRFAHVYINTTIENWLKWAVTPEQDYERLDYNKNEETAKIHPSIYSYMAYKAHCGADILRTAYTGEKPNADPRKWEMASKVLYANKQPEMLRSLIGEDLTADFTEFCKQQVISIEDVIKGNYSKADLQTMNTAEKYATAVGMSAVDEENLETVRNFVSEMGAEICATFDSLWVYGNEERLEKLAELKAIEAEKEIEER